MIATKKQLILELFLISHSNSFHDAEQSTSSIGQTRELDYRDGPDALSPDERVLLVQLTEQIDQLEEGLRYKKAA
jgi:hypothetical protein